jgi:hypothetical protein
VAETIDDALPWYCVQLILDDIDKLSSPSSSGSGLSISSLPPSQPALSRKDRLHRLHLILVSSLPSLPLGMLERCLECVRGILVGNSEEVEEEGERDKNKERKKELVQTLFELLLSEQMGQGEKEVGVRWWYENLGLLRGVDGEKDKREEGMTLQSKL